MKKIDTSPFNFEDLCPIEIPINNLLGKNYILVEADEGTAVEYQNLLFKSARFGDNGKPVGVDGLANAEPFLVSKCVFELYEVNDNGTKITKRRPVPLGVINSWPPRVVKQLHKKAMEISHLRVTDEAAEGEALKNEPSDTAPTSN